MFGHFHFQRFLLILPHHLSHLSCRSMNTFLIIYLGILLFEAILSTILKYAWQAENKWDEPFYNQKTDQERNSSQVSLCCLHYLAFKSGSSGFIKTAGDFLLTDFEVYFRLPGVPGVVQLYNPHLAVRDCWDAEVSGLFFHWLGLGSVPWRERPEGSSQHIRPQWGVGTGVCVRLELCPRYNTAGDE